MRRLKVVFTLTAALGLLLLVSAAVVAAPATAVTAQEDASGAAGVYVSSVYPAADASGLIEVLALYPNNNAQLVSFYVGKDAPIVEDGTWEAGEDQTVTVTLTGQPGQPYDNPSVVNYQVDGDTLVDGNFVFTKLTEVTPEEMDAGNAPVPDHGTPSSDDPAGSYVSNVYPAADASGLVQLLSLYENKNAQLISIYLGENEPIAEVGTWELDGDNVVLTITGTAEQAYDNPATTTYMRHGDALVDGNFVLNLLPVVTPEEMDAMTATGGDSATAGLSGSYVSNVYPAADAAGLIKVLSLFDNNNAEQTSIYITKDAITEVGTWEVDGSNALTLTITGTRDKEYDTPSVTVYQVDGETLVDGPFVLGKLREISFEDGPGTTYDDPFAYCAAVGTVDAPDAQYTGGELPESIVAGLREATGASADAPMENSVWRCADGKVMACTVGANIPCLGKADTSETPNEGMVAFCKEEPNAEVVPAVAAGRTTVYEWSCKDGEPALGKQILTPDAQGFISEFWYPIEATE